MKSTNLALIGSLAIALLGSANPLLAPLPPDDVKTDRMDASTIEITWEPPLDPDGRGVEYYDLSRASLIAEPSLDAYDFRVIASVIATPSPSYLDTTLEAGGHYVYYVQAVNDHGASAPSRPVYSGDYPHCDAGDVSYHPPDVEPNEECLTPPPGP